VGSPRAASSAAATSAARPSLQCLWKASGVTALANRFLCSSCSRSRSWRSSSLACSSRRRRSVSWRCLSSSCSRSWHSSSLACSSSRQRRFASAALLCRWLPRCLQSSATDFPPSIVRYSPLTTSLMWTGPSSCTSLRPRIRSWVCLMANGRPSFTKNISTSSLVMPKHSWIFKLTSSTVRSFNSNILISSPKYTLANAAIIMSESISIRKLFRE